MKRYSKERSERQRNRRDLLNQRSGVDFISVSLNILLSYCIKRSVIEYKNRGFLKIVLFVFGFKSQVNRIEEFQLCLDRGRSDQ